MEYINMLTPDSIIGLSVGVMLTSILFDFLTGDIRKMYPVLKKENEDLKKKNDNLTAEIEESAQENDRIIDNYNELVELYNQLLAESENANNRIARLESRLNRNVKYKE